MQAVKNPRNAKLVEITCACGCGEHKMVRAADVARGWGKYINKSHKARHQTKTHPFKDGKSQPKGGYKGGIENASPEVRANTLIAALKREDISPEYFYHMFPTSQMHKLTGGLLELYNDMEMEECMSESEMGWDAHKQY